MAAPEVDELLDVLDATGRRLGVERRSVVHRDGLWHSVFHCLMVRSVLPVTVVLQRRRLHAKAFPGRLDLSVTGHLVADELPVDGVRELREELGLDVSPDRLVALGTRLLADDSGEGRNRERAHVFLIVEDRPLADFRLDPGEVDGLVEIAVEDLLNLLHTPNGSVTCATVGAHGLVGEIVCTSGDLVPMIDGYWSVLALMADRLVRGQSPLAI
jgi:isopentenyldiphosphate isomerase